MVEGARLEIWYTPKGYRGFEPLPLRHDKTLAFREELCRNLREFVSVQKVRSPHFLDSFALFIKKVRVLCLIVFFASDVAPPTYWLSRVDCEWHPSIHLFGGCLY